jgi:hypothetical protein
MKRDFLTELFKKANIEVDKATIDAIMDENGRDIETSKAALSKAENDLTVEKASTKSLTEQLAQRDTDIAALKTQAGTSAELQKKLDDLQAQYTKAATDHKTAMEAQAAEMQKKLDDQARDHAVDRYFSGIGFTSDLSRDAAISAFKAQAFKLAEDGSFQGADDWLKKLKESNPAAFKGEEDNGGEEGAGAPGGQNNPFPKFTKPLNGGKPADDKPVFFQGGGFNFVRQPPQK